MIINVRTSDSPYLADWFVISLRWVILLAMAVALSAGALTWATGALLLFATLWNLFNSMLTVRNRRMDQHRLINVLVDGAVSFLLFLVTGGLNGPLLWSSLLALFSSAIYFEVRGVMLTAAVLSLAQGVVTIIQMRPADPVVLMLLGLLNLAVGLLLGISSVQLIQWLRRLYRRQIDRRSEDLQFVQHQERVRVRNLYQMVETLNATLNYQKVLETALDLVPTALGFEESYGDKMVSAVLLFAEHNLQVGASRGLPASDLRAEFQADQGALAEAIKSGETQLVVKPAADPELKQMAAVQGAGCALLLPLNRGLDSYGVMLFTHADPAFFNAERRELIEVISHQAGIAIQNARLFQDLEQEKERIIESQEEARKELARDLHDGPAQSLAAIGMRISLVRKTLDQNPAETSAELERIEELARRTTHEVRHMLFTLRPLVLESEGLDVALQAMADKMSETYRQNMIVEVDPAVVQQMEITRQTAIFYLAEEAVNNARKHARASEIRVRLQLYGQSKSLALLEVIDDGAGFDLASVQDSYDRRGSLGMVNLRERAELISGLLQIDSGPGEGTRVSVYIPLTEEAADRLQRGQVGA